MRITSYVKEINELADLMKSTNKRNSTVFIFEGFDGVGKTKTAEIIKGKLEGKGLTKVDIISYGWNKLEPDFNERYKYVSMVLKVLKCIDYPYKTLNSLDNFGIIDRWLFSSLVYDRIYNNSKREKEIKEKIDYSLSEYLPFKVCPVLFKLDDISLKERFKSLKERPCNEDYDFFEDFEEYSKDYKLFTNEYKEVIEYYSDKYNLDSIVYTS